MTQIADDQEPVLKDLVRSMWREEAGKLGDGAQFYVGMPSLISVMRVVMPRILRGGVIVKG